MPATTSGAGSATSSTTATPATLFLTMAGNGDLSEVMQERMKKGSKMPGWVKSEDFDWYATLADREDD